MNSEKKSVVSGWRGMAASVPGNGHIRRELPCQDASAYIDFGHPALIALDGRGSSPLSQEGSAEGVALFRSVLSIVDPWLGLVLDRCEPSESAVRHLGEIVHRTLVQAKKNCVRNHNGEVNVDAFDFTAAVVIVGRRNVVCFQVGDGAIVVSGHGATRAVFVPDKGDETNSTRFVRERDDGFRMEVLPADGIDGIAVMTDGIEHRVLDLRTLSPGAVFEVFFEEMRSGAFLRSELLSFLTATDLWARGDDARDDDDRTLVIAVPVTENPQEADSLSVNLKV